MNRFIGTALTVLAGFSAAHAREAIQNDYAYGSQIASSNYSAFNEFIINEQAYRGMTRGDLRDICVFNGNGETAPFSVRRVDGEISGMDESAALPLFPLYRDQSGRPDNISLYVKKDETGTLVTLDTGSAPKPEEQKLYSYILDASALNNPMTALELEWEPGLREGIYQLALEVSDDFEQWHFIDAKATIASLNYSGHNLIRREIRLVGLRARYLRLSPVGMADMIRLTKVTARMRSAPVKPERQWISAQGILQMDRQNEYLFDATGFFPVDRLRVGFPQKNTIAQAEFFSRANPSAPWTLRQSSVIYDLEIEENPLASPDLELRTVNDRYWMMRVDKNGGGIGEGTPILEFGWLPHSLLFIGKGTPPFTFAYGNGQGVVCTGRMDNILKGIKEAQHIDSGLIERASLGQQVVLGGAAALHPAVQPYNWKNVILWAILVCGVIFMAWMAVSLHRQMDREE